TDVAQFDCVGAAVGYHQLVEVGRILNATQGANGQLARAFVHATARHFHVLHAHGVRYFRDGHVVGAHFVRVNIDLDFPLATADDLDLTDAVHALDILLDLLVCCVRHL